MKRIWQGVVLLMAAAAAGGMAEAQGDMAQRAAAFKSGHGEAAEAAPAGGAAPKAAHKTAPGALSAVGGAKRVAHAAEAGAHDAGGAVGAEEALERLLQGNRRYLSGKALHPNSSPKRRSQVASGQHPFAVVVSCSDSRVPPEVLFDQGVGDLFVVRSAGHVVDDVALGSIEYAVEHLGVNLVLVLGHERCGAVDATLKGGDAPGHVNALVQAIRPAVERSRGKHGDPLCNAVKSNVKLVAEKIRSSAGVLSEAVDDGMLAVVGAYYDLDSGAATLTYKPRL